jgi:hypothetical protein
VNANVNANANASAGYLVCSLFKRLPLGAGAGDTVKYGRGCVSGGSDTRIEIQYKYRNSGTGIGGETPRPRRLDEEAVPAHAQTAAHKSKKKKKNKNKNKRLVLSYLELRRQHSHSLSSLSAEMNQTLQHKEALLRNASATKQWHDCWVYGTCSTRVKQRIAALRQQLKLHQQQQTQQKALAAAAALAQGEEPSLSFSAAERSKNIAYETGKGIAAQEREHARQEAGADRAAVLRSQKRDTDAAVRYAKAIRHNENMLQKREMEWARREQQRRERIAGAAMHLAVARYISRSRSCSCSCSCSRSRLSMCIVYIY